MTTKQNIQRVAHHKHLISANGCPQYLKVAKYIICFDKYLLTFLGHFVFVWICTLQNQKA